MAEGVVTEVSLYFPSFHSVRRRSKRCQDVGSEQLRVKSELRRGRGEARPEPRLGLHLQSHARGARTVPSLQSRVSEAVLSARVPYAGCTCRLVSSHLWK